MNTAVSASPCVVSTKYSNTFLKLDVLPAPDLPVNTMDWVDREFTAVLDREYFVGMMQIFRAHKKYLSTCRPPPPAAAPCPCRGRRHPSLVQPGDSRDQARVGNIIIEAVMKSLIASTINISLKQEAFKGHKKTEHRTQCRRET